MTDLRALLVTDVVDSTQIAQSLGDAAMAALWAEHDRVARDLLPEWRGREIDKSDGMLLLFDSAGDAAGYAVAYHSALAALSVPLKARAGLHVGLIAMRLNDNADVARGAKPLELDGLAKPTAARVMSLAIGGQTLLSSEARRALDGGPRKMQSHGYWMMKGLSEPMEIFELGTDDRPFVGPQDGEKGYRVVRRGERWLPTREIPTNLPHSTTRFIGRNKELAMLRDLLARRRLLTLTGSGGCGKTRLSLQLAAESIHMFADGAWCVELAALSDPGLVPQAVAMTLGLKEEQGTAIDDTLVAYLERKHMLLVLDNCEHLLDRCAMLANTLLRRCPRVTIVSSSREALALDGEQVFRVPSLPVPDPKRTPTRESIDKCESAQLFVDRALRSRSDFEVTDHNAASLASICVRLDGIPLAIELAAARVGTLSIEQIHQRLDQRFQLLTGGSRAALPRQQTLRSLIDWSYDLLRDREKTALQALSVFAAGWTLSAAEHILAGEDAGAIDLLDTLTALVDKSLVTVEQGREPRYSLLETIRQYARERLLETGSDKKFCNRHLEYFVAFVETSALEANSPRMVDALQGIETEHENLRAALEWSCGAGAPQYGLRLCGALWQYWFSRSFFSEGRAWCARILSISDSGQRTSERAKGLATAAALAYFQADYPVARARHEESLAIRRELGDRKAIAVSLGDLGAVVIEQGDFAYARQLLEESLAIARDVGNEKGVAFALLNLAVVANAEGDPATASDLYLESLAIQRRVGNQRGIAQCLNNLGNLALDQGAMSSAKDFLEESLQVTRELADKDGMATNLLNLGNVAHEQGDLRAAAALHDESYEIFREIGDLKGIVCWLEAKAAWLASHGRPSAAARTWGAAAHMREELGAPLPRNEQVRYEQLTVAARSALEDAAAFDAAWLQGRQSTLEEAITFVLGERVAGPTNPSVPDARPRRAHRE